MEFNDHQNKVAEKIATYLIAELQIKTGRRLFTDIEEERNAVALNNILALVMEDAEIKIDGYIEGELSEKNWATKEESIKSATLQNRKELIEAGKKCYAGDCTDLDNMIDDICK